VAKSALAAKRRRGCAKARRTSVISSHCEMARRGGGIFAWRQRRRRTAGGDGDGVAAGGGGIKWCRKQQNPGDENQRGATKIIGVCTIATLSNRVISVAARGVSLCVAP